MYVYLGKDKRKRLSTIKNIITSKTDLKYDVIRCKM